MGFLVGQGLSISSSCLFRARRGELFAAVAVPCLPPSHPGEPRATMCTFCLFKILNIEPLKLALEAKDLTLGLYCSLQRRSFRRQFPPQLEGDFGHPAVGFSYRFEQVLSFIFGHVPPEFLCVPQWLRSKDLQDFIRSQTLIIEARLPRPQAQSSVPWSGLQMVPGLT